jgi:hypothetical protein
MTLEERQVIYKQLEDQKGRKHQILVVIEEMSELTKELTKFLREDSYTNTKKLCEEMADAKVVLEQLDRFFDPEQKLVPFIMDYKLERLKMFYLAIPLTKTERKIAFEEDLGNSNIINEFSEWSNDQNKRVIIFNKQTYLRDKMTKAEANSMLKLGGIMTIKKSSNDIIGSRDFDELIFGILTKYKTTSFYDWEIGIKDNGLHSILRFQNEKEFINQDIFLKLCIRELHFLPDRIPIKKWTEIINKALANLKICDD